MKPLGVAISLICGIAIGLGLGSRLCRSGEEVAAASQAEVLQTYWSSAGKEWSAVEKMLGHGSRKLLVDAALLEIRKSATEGEIRSIYGPPDAVGVCGEPDPTMAGVAYPQCKIRDGKTIRAGYYAYKLGKFSFRPDRLSYEALIIGFDDHGNATTKSVRAVEDASPLAMLSEDSRTDRRIAAP